jgi:ketosteroid isomerase-like protein
MTMATAVTDAAREQLAAIPASYFRAVDAKDVSAVLAHFADDATLTVQTAGVTFSGHDEIGRMFSDFFGEWDSMVHEITNIVVDPSGSKVSTEQHVDLNRNGTTKMHNCNFFDVNSDGQFSRVIIWMDGTNPLK